MEVPVSWPEEELYGRSETIFLPVTYSDIPETSTSFPGSIRPEFGLTQYLTTYQYYYFVSGIFVG